MTFKHTKNSMQTLDAVARGLMLNGGTLAISYFPAEHGEEAIWIASAMWGDPQAVQSAESPGDNAAEAMEKLLTSIGWFDLHDETSVSGYGNDEPWPRSRNLGNRNDPSGAPLRFSSRGTAPNGTRSESQQS